MWESWRPSPGGAVEKTEKIPHAARKCGARTRTGTPCKNWAMSNGRCRMHGGLSTGPRTPEGLERVRQANLRHGHYSAEAISERRLLRQFLHRSRETIERISTRAGTVEQDPEKEASPVFR